MVNVELDQDEAEVLKDTLDWLIEQYGPITNPVLAAVRQKLRYAVSG